MFVGQRRLSTKLQSGNYNTADVWDMGLPELAGFKLHLKNTW